MRNVLIVTGGGRGIGAAVSRLAATRRYAVCVHYRSDKTFLCSKEAVLRMSTAHGGPGGAIVNVSSAASRLGSPGEYVDYAASKGAMDTLTTGLSVEVAREGIRVNAVRPGFIRTTMHADGGEPGRVDRLQHLLPMGRGGEPEEVAEAVVWLLSEAASFVTGSFIDLAGGK